MLLSPAPVARADQTRATLALLTAGVLSTFVLVSLPLLVGAMAAESSWGDRQVGWLASADMAGSALASLCIIPLIARLPWRPIACLAITIAVTGNLLSLPAQEFHTLMGARLLTGVGNGLMLSLAYVGLCRSGNPDRWFGLYVFAQLSMQVVALSIFPSVLAAHGLDAIYCFLAAIAACCLPLVLWFPKKLQPARGSTPAAGISGERPISLAAGFALSAQGLYFLAPAAVWGYFERIGAGFALSLEQIGFALGMSSFAAIAGALLVIALGERIGRGWSMAVGTMLSIVATVMLVDGTGFAHFLGAAALFNFAWNYTFPYQMGALSSLDRSGGVAIASLIVQLAGLALGPLLASTLHPEKGYEAILTACIGCYAVSLLLFRVSSRNHA